MRVVASPTTAPLRVGKPDGRTLDITWTPYFHRLFAPAR
jgi:hypothetical protein